MAYTFGKADHDNVYITLVDRTNPKNPTLLEANDMDKERVEIVLNDIIFAKDKLKDGLYLLLRRCETLRFRKSHLSCLQK